MNTKLTENDIKNLIYPLKNILLLGREVSGKTLLIKDIMSLLVKDNYDVEVICNNFDYEDRGFSETNVTDAVDKLKADYKKLKRQKNKPISSFPNKVTKNKVIIIDNVHHYFKDNYYKKVDELKVLIDSILKLSEIVDVYIIYVVDKVSGFYMSEDTYNHFDRIMLLGNFDDQESYLAFNQEIFIKPKYGQGLIQKDKEPNIETFEY